MPNETSLQVLLNVFYHKKHQYTCIWIRGGNLNVFQDIKHFMNEWGGACPSTPWETSPSVLLTASYHKE